MLSPTGSPSIAGLENSVSRCSFSDLKVPERNHPCDAEARQKIQGLSCYFECNPKDDPLTWVKKLGDWLVYQRPTQDIFYLVVYTNEPIQYQLVQSEEGIIIDGTTFEPFNNFEELEMRYPELFIRRIERRENYTISSLVIPLFPLGDNPLPLAHSATQLYTSSQQDSEINDASQSRINSLSSRRISEIETPSICTMRLAVCSSVTVVAIVIVIYSIVLSKIFS